MKTSEGIYVLSFSKYWDCVKCPLNSPDGKTTGGSQKRYNYKEDTYSKEDKKNLITIQ